MTCRADWVVEQPNIYCLGSVDPETGGGMQLMWVPPADPDRCEGRCAGPDDGPLFFFFVDRRCTTTATTTSKFYDIAQFDGSKQALQCFPANHTWPQGALDSQQQ